MAHILKYPTNSCKGIVIFTHKEWGFFTGSKVVRRLKREGRLPKRLFDELRQPYKRKLAKIKKKYLVGVHFGAYYPHFFDSSNVDFVMSCESNLPKLADHIYRIPLNSRDFTPVVFSAKDKVKKVWDVMTVAQNVKVKNSPLLFESIKQALNLNLELTFLIIAPSQKGVKYGVEKDLAKLFYEMFSRDEQGQITFLYLHPELQWGLHQKQLSYFYNCSKVFTLFSKQEGESRVVSEALCSGLPVVLYKHILGGAADLLNENNSVLFDDFNSAHVAWTDAIKKFPSGIGDDFARTTREDYTVLKLIDYFYSVFKQHGDSYDGQLDDVDLLYRKLPAHHYDVSWRKSETAPTADILSRAQFERFEKDLGLH